MDTKEIYDKLKRGQVSYDELLNWCNENKDKMNLNDSYESSLYNTLINYSMKNRIGKLNREEASIYLKFFAKKTAKDLRLDKKVVIEVLDAESYKKRDEKLSEKNKEINQLEWMKLMNNYKNTAEEIILKKLIYTENM